jgi:hypothetical protein
MQNKVKAINVYLTEHLGDGNRGVTDASESDQSVCSIRITGFGENESSGDIKSVQQALAHELYHCVQRTYGVDLPVQDTHRPANWWFEGSAEYFANIFFPDTRPDHMQSYHPRFQLFNQRGSSGYGASLFFQHLSNTFTPDIAIHNWVVARKDSTAVMATRESEQRWLSSDTFITNAFPSFATQFFDGRILYNNDQPVLTSLRKATPTYMSDIPKKPGVYSVVTRVLPFTIWETLKIALPSERLISFTFKTPFAQDSGTVLQYRKVDDVTWKTVPKEASTTIDAGCSVYQFLATSTLDADLTKTFDVTITFTVKKRPQKHKQRRQEVEGNPVPGNGSTSDDVAVNPDVSTPSNGTPGEVTVVSISENEGDEDDQEGSSCPTSTCLNGDWNLDIPSMQSYLTHVLSTTASTKLTNLAVTGTSSLRLTANLSSSMTFTNLTIAYDGTASGYSFRTVIALAGFVVGSVKLGANDTFTWVTSESDGTVTTVTTIDALGDPWEYDFPLSEQYGPGTEVRYTCEENTLDMSGFVGGRFVWAYTWRREVVA